jgi:hypothetical protein
MAFTPQALVLYPIWEGFDSTLDRLYSFLADYLDSYRSKESESGHASGKRGVG